MQSPWPGIRHTAPPRHGPRPPRPRAAAALTSLLLAACSTLPSRRWPDHDEREVLAEFAVAAGAPVELPKSGTDLTIFELSWDPCDCHEEWRDGKRLLVAGAGCDRIRVRCRYRAYARSGVVPTPFDLFPGARIADQATGTGVANP